MNDAAHLVNLFLNVVLVAVLALRLFELFCEQLADSKLKFDTTKEVQRASL